MAALPSDDEGSMTESQTEPTEASPAPAESVRRRGRTRSRSGLLVPSLALAVVVLLVLSVVFGLKVRSDSKEDDARAAAVAAATAYAVDLTTYDHSRLEADFSKVLDNSTGSFKSEYTAASASLRDLIAKFKATATGKVLETAVLSSDTDRATILLFVDQTVSNNNSKTPRIDRSRMKMGLEKQGGRWLISSLDLL
jgi:Mce-associated membrane protein